MTAPLTLETLNGLDREAFVQALAGIFENSPWIPRQCFGAAPFASVVALHRAMVTVVDAAPLADKLRLLRAHPELAGKAARHNQLTEASASEQARLGLNDLADEEAVNFNSQNWLYRQRFGFPFIIAVRGQRDRRAILLALEARTNNTESDEVKTALAEVAKIAWFRLSDLVSA